MGAKGKIVIDRERCKGCYLCTDVCPNKNIEVDPDLNKKGYRPVCFVETGSESKKGCTGCTLCAIVCPEVAIEVYRES